MSLFNIGLSGLNAANAGLSVAAHNTTNSLTPGYSRQRITFGSEVSGGNYGSGVKVTDIERMSDNYLNLQIQNQRSGFGFQEVTSQLLIKSEHLLTNESTSLSVGLDRFYSSLNEASAKPQDLAYRQTMISQSEALVHRFNNFSSQLESQKKQVDGQLNASVTEVNTLLSSIASINKTLKDSNGKENEMSSLLDSRDEHLAKLSSMMDIKTSYNNDGTVNVNLGKGQPLINGSNASYLSKDDNGNLELSRGKNKYPLNEDVGGKLGGYISYRDNELKDLSYKLDVMAYGFAKQFNEQHKKGYDLSGNSGTDFFGGVDKIEGAAKSISVAIKDPEKLAFSSSKDEPGNSENLQSMIELKNSSLSIDKGSLNKIESEMYGDTINSMDGKSLYNIYTGLSGDWAIKTSQSKSDLSASSELLKHAQSERDSLSGVNLDEEAINIMTYTQMYQANSKIISTAQQLLDITMNMFN
ncbi:flagellar hook-associated protein FlgK [Vibrio harveyi]|nr:flagellar hook-associated protein FlgK [Vibrio harveyi]